MLSDPVNHSTLPSFYVFRMRGVLTFFYNGPEGPLASPILSSSTCSTGGAVGASILTFSSDSVDGLSVTMVADGTIPIVSGSRLGVPTEVCDGAGGAAGIVGIHRE